MSSTAVRRKRGRDLILGALAGRVANPTDVARSEKALLGVNEGTLYFPIFYENREVGGIFIGYGQMIVDAIVETNRGALGKSYEFFWNGSLLLLTEDGEWLPPSTSPVRKGDLHEFLLSSEEEAQERAQCIFERFIDHNRNWITDTFFMRNHGWLATILDTQRGKCHIIASDDRFIVKIGQLKIVLTGNKLVHKEGRKKVLVAGRGGPIIRFG
ncbi:MAG: hypothetical protein Q6361_07070 [Candidatus Hermodarchaeota archaeon]|nr:hypothetical protein [Candidatus Hermodarchaeota archaeon]